MIVNFWNRKRTEISAISAACFILLDLWWIKIGEPLSINEFFVHLIIDILFMGVLLQNTYFIMKKKQNQREIKL
ncbi:MAG TPA: hypothetical protein VLZ75_04625 [Chitinophagales bacterium]|nr:hypothetical protein [Chitinophagales bacterium]